MEGNEVGPQSHGTWEQEGEGGGDGARRNKSVQFLDLRQTEAGRERERGKLYTHNSMCRLQMEVFVGLTAVNKQLCVGVYTCWLPPTTSPLSFLTIVSIACVIWTL